MQSWKYKLALRRDTVLYSLRWLGTGASIIGSFAVALGSMVLGYPSFLIGSACWLAVAYAIQDRALLALNVTFFIANILGLCYHVF